MVEPDGRSTSSLFESSTMLNRFGLAQDDAVDADEPEEAPAGTTKLSTALEEAPVPKMGNLVMNRIDIAKPRWRASAGRLPMTF